MSEILNTITSKLNPNIIYEYGRKLTQMIETSLEH